MTAPFVDTLRADADTIHLEVTGSEAIHVRVQSAELWRTVRVVVATWQLVGSVKAAALEAFFPGGADAADFMVKLHGFEILHEDASLAFVGVRNGSTLLLTRRRRRPVR